MRPPLWELLLRWLKSHPGVFAFQEEGEKLLLLESHSGKSLSLKSGDVDQLEERKNTILPAETYVLILLRNGQQLALSSHGFAFPPDFDNTGPMPLPSQVYCMEDFNELFKKLKHLASETERRQEALTLILLLIAILDGAKAVGLEVDRESQEVDDILEKLEKEQTLPSPHGFPS